MSEKDDFYKNPKDDAPSRADISRKHRGFLTHFFVMMLLGCGFAIICLVLVDVTNSGGKIKRRTIEMLGGEPEAPAPREPQVVERVVEKVVEVPVEKVVEKIVEVEVKPPMPSGYVSWKKVDTAELWSEIPVTTELVTEQGDTAVEERGRDQSYRIEMKVKVTLPKPNKSPEKLAAINPNLPEMLNDFSALVDGAEVSPFYYYLYELKTERVQQKVTRIDQLLSRHNFYDLETVLQMKHPETGEKVLLIQGEMDVVTDGSDGDRWPELDDYISMSEFYQPFTSYGWPKLTSTPNPLLKRWERKLKGYQDEFAIPGLSVERNRYLREQIAYYKKGVDDLKGRSFLIAEADPFIVLPLSFIGRQDENGFGPAIGDYAVIIYGDKLYPALAGDAGPSWKFGEASLRVARQLDEKASPYNRPVSDLKITYLVFPGSADPKKSQPDLGAWHRKCSELLDGIGGIGGGFELHQWEDLIAKKKVDEVRVVEEAEEAGGIESDTTTSEGAAGEEAP